MNTQTEIVASIPAVLRHRSLTRPGDPALLAPGRRPLDWAGLSAQVRSLAETFGGLGLEGGDRVAVVLPDGPELAAAFLTVSSFATFAPLNPAYRTEDFDFYLGDLEARALVVPAGQDSAARAVARKRGIRVLELAVEPGAPAGRFNLNVGDAPRFPAASPAREAAADDVALMLHTSGTTSRPKMVPLTHRNLCRSARHIATTLELSPGDRSLAVMPLFHIHGLIGVLLSSIWAGASVVCGPGFSADRFFAWLAEFKPSWYSAVPTMHQAILGRASAHGGVIKASPLRFIRSSSAALPPRVMSGLEEVFGAPVIEAYGMTEASHQMASNPLPPKARKPGSVGPAAGPEVGIMDESGQLLGPGLKGEIVIRGENVTAGYLGNPAANASAFHNGWFRTGDQGYLDADGYLFISGRLKEIINRGGEKIAPREIDDALMGCPGVRQAVAFAVKHPTLGEDIAAAVVPAGDHALDEPTLRAFAAARLPAFKVPSRIVLVAEIPKGPTGKVQRLGLADRLAAELRIAYEAPASETERLVCGIFEQVLRRDPIGRGDNFFASGGDSIRAMQAASRLREGLGLDIPPSLLFQYPTPALLAPELDRRRTDQDVAALAAELEKLPAEEIERLLGEVTGEPGSKPGSPAS